jgi:hypothetical protein
MKVIATLRREGAGSPRTPLMVEQSLHRPAIGLVRLGPHVEETAEHWHRWSAPTEKPL